MKDSQDNIMEMEILRWRLKFLLVKLKLRFKLLILKNLFKRLMLKIDLHIKQNFL